MVVTWTSTGYETEADKIFICLSTAVKGIQNFLPGILNYTTIRLYCAGSLIP